MTSSDVLPGAGGLLAAYDDGPSLMKPVRRLDRTLSVVGTPAALPAAPVTPVAATPGPGAGSAAGAGPTRPAARSRTAVRKRSTPVPHFEDLRTPARISASTWSALSAPDATPGAASPTAPGVVTTPVTAPDRPQEAPVRAGR